MKEIYLLTLREYNHESDSFISERFWIDNKEWFDWLKNESINLPDSLIDYAFNLKKYIESLDQKITKTDLKDILIMVKNMWDGTFDHMKAILLTDIISYDETIDYRLPSSIKDLIEIINKNDFKIIDEY